MSYLEQSISILAIGMGVVTIVFLLMYYGMVVLRYFAEELGWE